MLFLKENLEVPLDITESEYRKLKENLDLFNENLKKSDKLTFDEFINLIFETESLTERLDFKKDHLNVLKSEIRELEDELSAKCSVGLTNTNEEVIKSRKAILKDSKKYIGGLH